MKLRQLYELNDEVACFIGFLFNIAVMVLVVSSTNKCMKQYNIILFQSTVIDFMLLITTITVRPVSFY